ncbi:hypothetical protein M3193_03625 [Sporosarcina luteola]|uniref:hypothetical protein n=1 Tax=Sporosarcina luteola TaxID=582850 RepID=UPI00203BC1A5|nr:hypothetical protein [Sporosarcina luteola]MCM3743223.1 hypothetical protein [Sporosarcina luteola]
MKKYSKLFIGLLFALTLTGCFGEDYDVGVPTAHLYLGIGDIQLTEANISWQTQSEDVHETIEDVQEFGLSQDEIKVLANQEATLDFKENEKNGGDIWTDPEMSAVLISDGKQIEIEMNDNREFRFPSDKGNYVLEVIFKSNAGSAQYVGNILIQ